MLKYLLDTNIVIYTMKNRPRQVDRNLADIESMSARLEVLPFDTRAAYHFGQIRAALYHTKYPIGPYDMMIAGQARASGLVLVTNNLKEFEKVPGLMLEDWTETGME